MPRVKGLAFRSVFVALEALEGNAAVERVRALLPAETSERLRVLTASTWYPLTDYANLWTSIQSATGQRKDLPRLIGRRAVEQDLRLIHRVAFAALSVETVLSISMRLFGTYYDTGKCKTEQLAPRKVRVSFQGCLGFTEPMWTEVRGGIECFAEQASKTRATSSLISGGTELSPECVVEVSWFAKT